MAVRLQEGLRASPGLSVKSACKVKSWNILNDPTFPGSPLPGLQTKASIKPAGFTVHLA